MNHAMEMGHMEEEQSTKNHTERERGGIREVAEQKPYFNFIFRDR